MKKVSPEKQIEIRNLFVKTLSENHELDKYKDIYGKYFGCGNNLYFLGNEYEEEHIMKIMNQRIHPSKMAEQLSEYNKDFKIIMVDFEMGHASIYQTRR